MKRAKKEVKPEITVSLIKSGNVITEMVVKKVVKATGSGAHVVLPGELRGKYVTVIYKEDEQ